MQKYYPILVSKKGELTALRNLTIPVKQNIAPIIEIVPDTIDAVEKYFISDWTFVGNQVLFDFTYASTNIKRIENLFAAIMGKGVSAIPVVQINSAADYISHLKILHAKTACKICFRICNSSGGFVNTKQQVEDLMKQISISSNQVLLLFDFGYIEAHNYNLYPSTAETAIKSLPSKDWVEVIVSGGSFPKDLTDVKPAGRRHELPRYEWKMFESALKVAALKSIKYGDYGTNYPIFEVAAYGGTVSVKYTGKDNFIIYKGEMTDNHADGHGQYISHAKKLTATPDFSGAAFCWGDEKIDFYAGQSLKDPKKKTGNSTSWVEISQNHHISLLESLL